MNITSHPVAPLSIDPNRCGNCNATLDPEDKFCRYCGTRRGKGAFCPQENMGQCIYGPAPERYVYTCPSCGQSWEDYLMIHQDEYCPLCGHLANCVHKNDAEPQLEPVLSDWSEEDDFGCGDSW